MAEWCTWLSEQKVPLELLCKPCLSEAIYISTQWSHCFPGNEGPKKETFYCRRTSKAHVTWAHEWETQREAECWLWNQSGLIIGASMIGLWWWILGGCCWNVGFVTRLLSAPKFCHMVWFKDIGNRVRTFMELSSSLWSRHLNTTFRGWSGRLNNMLWYQMGGWN